MLFSSASIILSLLSFGLVAHAAPRGPGGPTHPPGCPYEDVKAGRTRVFLRYWYDPSGIVLGDGGGFRAYTKDHFFNDFTITDKTTTYPKDKPGKKYPAPGKYATSRIQFADIHEKYRPKAYEVLGIPEAVGDLPCYGGSPNNDCLTRKYECTYEATLQKPYGGKPAGTKVRWLDTRVIKFDNFTARDNGQDYKIKSATIKMDWSSFYT